MKKALKIWPRRILGGAFGVLSLVWLYTALFWQSTPLDFPEIHAHLNAKEICTCVFVEDLPDVDCRRIHRKLMDPSHLEINREKHYVEARTFFAIARAEYVDEFEGCRTIY